MRLGSRFPNRAIISLGAFAAGASTVIGLAATYPAGAESALTTIASAVSCATTAACVAGSNTSSGPGVSGSSKKGVAITAAGISGVKATGTTGYGVEGYSPTNSGVAGLSVSSNGVYASSSSGYGVYATTTKGTAAISGNNTISGHGGYGVSGYGDYGIYGTGEDGVVGAGNEIGVYGSVTGSAIGMEASAENNDGLQAYSVGGDAIYGSSGSNGADIQGYEFGIIGRSDYYPLEATNLAGNTEFYVTGSGDIYYNGSLNQLTVRHGTTVRSFSAKSTTPTVEDTGSAQLIGGVAAVRLDPTFAASIDPNVTYRVLITPDGDTRGLYVASKSPAGFMVRETQGGRSTLSFDYRIVATSLGAAGQRMGLTNVPPLPRTLSPRHPAKLMAEPVTARR